VSVGLTVFWSGTVISLAEVAELIEMLFGLRTRVCPRKHVLDARPDAPMGRGKFFGKAAAHCKV